MSTIPIRQHTAGIDIVVPIYSKEIVIALDETVTEDNTPFDFTGYTITFTFAKYDVEGVLIATVCHPGSVTTVPVPNTNTTMPAATLKLPVGVLDTVGNTKMTVRMEWVAQGLDRTPNQELVFKVIPTPDC